MEETVYYDGSGVHVTDKQIVTKNENVLIRDISAVQLRSPTGSVFLCLVVAAISGLVTVTTDLTGIKIVAAIVTLAFLGAAAAGRNLVVTTHGGKQVSVASGLVSDMRRAKNAIARAMTEHPQS